MRSKKNSILILSLIFSFVVSSEAQYSDEEVKKTAIEKGKLAANYWVKNSGKNPGTTDYYADICSFYGACIFGDAIGDTTFYSTINKNYNRTTPIKTDNIDENSCGILPLHLYLHNKKQNLLKLGIDAAEANIKKGGHVRNAIDDTYMTGSLMVQAYRATDSIKYINFFADYLTNYMKNLQQSNGLYWHHKDVSHQFWGRGNGWGAASTSELLQVISPEHSKYNDIVSGYKKQMKGLIDVQLSSGMWQQLLGSTSSKNWEESSGTSMFIFALFTGLELGILDKETYLEPAKKGWMAVIKYLSNDGKLSNVAEGFWPKAGTPDEYLNAQKASPGNSHGTAGFLWAATAIVRYYNKTGTINKNNLIVIKPTFTSAEKIQYFDLQGRRNILKITENNFSSIPMSIIIQKRNGSSRTITTLY